MLWDSDPVLSSLRHWDVLGYFGHQLGFLCLILFKLITLGWGASEWGAVTDAGQWVLRSVICCLALVLVTANHA